MLKELDVQTMEETNGGTFLLGGLLWGVLGAIFTRPTRPTCPTPAPAPTCPAPKPTCPAPKPTCP